MQLNLPEMCLVVLVGPSGAGKSTFARTHFKPTEVLSSDTCRALICDDENDQSVSKEAFDLLHTVLRKRLKLGKLAVVDATSVRPGDRAAYVEIAKAYHVLPVAIVLNMPPELCLERNAQRSNRSFGEHVVRNHSQALRKHLKGLKREGFRQVTVLSSPEEVAAVQVQRQKLWSNRTHDHGPFDIIGDIHGCFTELVELLTRLGYAVDANEAAPSARHPAGRRALFLGDLVDRGPNSPAVLRLVMHMVRQESALCVPGNHDNKLMRHLQGRPVTIAHGLAETLAQLEPERAEFKAEVIDFVHGLVSHLVLDDGKLVVAHAGMRADLQGRASARVRDFAMYGETTGEIDAFGLPVRQNWAADYRGEAAVVYGHTPVPEAEWFNRTLCVDTGCVFGGKLTALRYPEKELVQVQARQVYCEPVRPLQPAEAPRPHDVLDIDDVSGRRVIQTALQSRISVREENAAAALEVMSRFAADPRWLIYLPPTMAPPESHSEAGLLEHPREVFKYFRSVGVQQVVCQEKHMGSRAVLVVCRSAAVAARRFGVADQGIGLVYTRTGRPFFLDPAHQEEVLARVQQAMASAGLWESLQTDWVCLDAEIMPWSAKAGDLLRRQYAPTGTAARHGLEAALKVLQQAATRDDCSQILVERFATRAKCAQDYAAAYRRYCWPVHSVADLRIAPFHLLATEKQVHHDKTHLWHMQTLARLCAADPQLLHPTAHQIAQVQDDASLAQSTAWWEALTEAGGEGMVVKPMDWVANGPRGLVQPALKCRGRSYLRLIYGPEYTQPEHLERLRQRNLSAKRGLALREFSLGLEALSRFCTGEPLYKVHECVFGVLAMESEPVDPRL